MQPKYVWIPHLNRKTPTAGFTYPTTERHGSVTVRCPQILLGRSADGTVFTAYVQSKAPKDVISHTSTKLYPHSDHFTHPRTER